MDKKITIIGAGNVGATLASLIAQAGLADVVLFDIVEGMPQGKALDMTEACPLWASSAVVKGTNDYNDIASSDIVVITAGLARKPGMSRDDLLMANAGIMKSAAIESSTASPDAIFIIVTNPMDVMSQLAKSVTGFPPERVIGMGGVLDAARFRTFAALELNVSFRDVDALVLGGHGDQMVPMPRFTTVKGIPITEILEKERIDAIVDRTKNGGAEIVSLLKTGSAYYAPAASAFEMVKSVLLDEKRALPCSVYLKGEYGINGVYTGVPAVLGSAGAERIIELKLDERESRMLRDSAGAVKALVEKLGIK